MAHRIEAAKSGRSACVTCGTAIAKGDVRIAELYQDASIGPPSHGGYRHRDQARAPIYRFHHLACAIAAVPAVVRTALDERHDEALIADRPALDAQLAAAVEAERKKRVEAATARLGAMPAHEPTPADAHLEPLLAQLADDPEDVSILAVIGDLLVARDDPQGELITVQLAARTAAPDRAPETAVVKGVRDRKGAPPPAAAVAVLIKRRDELMMQLTPRLDAADRSHWGTGFVRRLELGEKSCARLAELAALWRHPVMRVLVELRLDLPLVAELPAVFALLVEHVPRSLRRLELAGAGATIDPLVAVLPRLEHLVLRCAAGPGLAHPTVHTLEIANGAVAETILSLSRDKLPAVTSLVVHQWRSLGTAVELAQAGWLAQLRRLAFVDPAPATRGMTNMDEIAIDAAMVEPLRAGLAGHKLARLELAAMRVPLPLRAELAALCDELVCPTSAALAATTTHAEHAGKPEWGRGKIVRRFEGKVELDFGKAGGKKVFRVDAPFLRFVSD